MRWLYHSGEIHATPQLFEGVGGNFSLLVQDRGGAIYIYDLGTTFDADAVEWGGFGNDLANTGLYVAPSARISGGVTLTSGELLHGNHPNPFNPATRIAYTLPRALYVELSIFDVGGRHVRTLVRDILDGGEHENVWDGTNAAGAPVPSGVYFYRLVAGSTTVHHRMVMLR